MKLLLAGDTFVSPEWSMPLFSDDIKLLFESVDYRVVNLEGPLVTGGGEPIRKTGPNLKMDEAAIECLSNLKVDLAVLANNHIMDFGSEGLASTIAALRRSGISWVGAGRDQDEAAEPFILGDSVAILSFAENEWATAGPSTAGANGLDIIENVKQIQKAKREFEKVICVIHGGNEYFPYPSPRMKKQYRFYVDNGADAIVGHHPHCVSGVETYRNAPIMYSLGNFIFTLDSPYTDWYRGALATLEIRPGLPVTYQMTPVLLGQAMPTCIADGQNKRSVLADIAHRSKVISDDRVLKEEWDNFVADRVDDYLSHLLPLNNYLKVAIRRSGMLSTILTPRYVDLVLNLIRCEAHRDLLQSVLLKEREE